MDELYKATVYSSDWSIRKRRKIVFCYINSMMEIFELSAAEYENIIKEDIPVFIRKDFLELNRDKVEKIHYIIGKDTKARFLFAVGEKNGGWYAPFSAPFSNIVFLRKNTSVECIWEFVDALVKYIKSLGGKELEIYLPADVYGFQNNSRLLNAMLGNGFQIVYQDVNYSFDLTNFSEESYSDIMHHNARKNLRIGLESGNEFIRCDDEQSKRDAYNIIRINREHRGFPLRMTEEQVMETIQIVDHDFFLVRNNEQLIAAAVVYKITNTIAQVVYWGDIPDAGQYKPINYLSFNLLQYYKKLGFEILDIGISTEHGTPNYGLCSFKESLGCVASSKFLVRKEL